MVAGEGLGIGDQFPALSTEFIHQLNKAYLLRMVSRDQGLVVQPELLNLASPALATGNEAQLCVFPGHQRFMSRWTLKP